MFHSVSLLSQVPLARGSHALPSVLCFDVIISLYIIINRKQSPRIACSTHGWDFPQHFTGGHMGISLIPKCQRCSRGSTN